jgi:hypothetical protein
MSASLLSGESVFTRNPPPSTKMRLLKSTLARRVRVSVVFAHSRSARPEPTIARRSVTPPTIQLILRLGSPTVRPIWAITRLQMSIE